MRELREKFEKWYGNIHRKHRNKMKQITDGKYDNSFIQLSYTAFIAGYTRAINTPKHETVDEWENRTGESYHPESPVWVYETHPIKSLGYDWMLRDYRYSCIYGCEKVLVAMNNHGKPEIGE